MQLFLHCPHFSNQRLTLTKPKISINIFLIKKTPHETDSSFWKQEILLEATIQFLIDFITLNCHCFRANIFELTSATRFIIQSFHFGIPIFFSFFGFSYI